MDGYKHSTKENKDSYEQKKIITNPSLGLGISIYLIVNILLTNCGFLTFSMVFQMFVYNSDHTFYFAKK